MADIIFKLRHPVEFGKDSEPVSELALKRSARAFKEFSLPMQGNGSACYQPYALAQVGVRMGGKADPFLDKMDPEDMQALAQVVLGFLGLGLGTGDTP